MRARSRAACVMALAVCALLGAASQSIAGSQADFFRDMAAQDRAHAADARARAKQWEDMAAKARARAASSTGAFRDSWLQSAQDDQTSANQLEDEANGWDQKARDFDTKAEMAEKEATAPSQPSSAPSVAGNPNPPSTGVPGAGESGTIPTTTERQSKDLVLGRWINPANGSTIEINQAGTSDDESLVLKGRHGDWKGKYTAASGSTPPRLVFQRKPSASEMDPAAPRWARKRAEGTLEWILELESRGECEPVLSGKWYRGEVQWSIDGRRDASAVSHVSEVAVAYIRDEKPDLQMTSQPGLFVLTDRRNPWPAESLDRDQPFYVEARLSYDDAARAGRTLVVKFEVPASGRSFEVTLAGAPHHGPTIYTTDAPILFDRPFNIAGPSDLVASPYESVNLRSLKLKNGDLVKVSYRDVSTSFRFYKGWVQQGIARNDDAFEKLLRVYNAQLLTGTNSKQREALHRKIHFITNARYIINDYNPPSPDDQLTDLQRFYVGENYHALLADGVAQDSKLWQGKPYVWDRFGIEMLSLGEQNLVAEGMAQGRKKFDEDFFHTIPAGLSLGLYHIVAQLSGGDQIWTALFGVNEDGQPVDRTARLFAGIGFASGALFSVASSAYLTELSPEAGANMHASGEPVDEPSAEDFQINPDTPATIERTIEEIGAPTQGTPEEPDLALARRAYGPNATLRTPAQAEGGILQVSNYNCLVEVARVHIRKGTGFAPREAELRTAVAMEGYARPFKGTALDGYKFLIEKFGGKAGSGKATIAGLNRLRQANYLVNAVLRPLTGGKHAVDFRGIIQGATTDYVVIGDPYFGSDVMMPVCDFAKVFINPKTGQGRFSTADFGQAQALK